MMRLFKGIRAGNIYGCTTGDYVGTMLLFVESNNDSYGFLKIPTMENMWVPKDKFNFGLKQGIIEYIEKVPRYVKKTAATQFEANKRGEEL